MESRGTNNYCIAVEKPDHQCSNEALMNCECKFSVAGCVYSHTPHNLPVVDFHPKESPVNVLRDTGCSGVVLNGT